MDANWASPWEDEAPTFTTETAVPAVENPDATWNIGDDWASSAWASFDSGKAERARRLSETSGWGGSDGQKRVDGDRHDLESLKLRPLSLPVPPRQPSPDPWATVSSINGVGRIRGDDFGSKGNGWNEEAVGASVNSKGIPELQEKENVGPEGTGTADIAQDLDPWAAVSSITSERVGVIRDDVVSPGRNEWKEEEAMVATGVFVDSKGRLEPQEKENLNCEGSGIAQDLHSICRNSNMSDVEEVQETKRDGHEKSLDQPKALANGNPDLQNIPTDTTSSRPSSSPSDHGDHLTESSRTSFEQEPTQDPSKVKKVVSHSDRLEKENEEMPVATRTESPTESKSNDTSRPAEILSEEDPEDDDFGDFEEETEDSGFQVSGGNDGSKSHVAVVNHEVSFDINLSLIEKLFSEICPVSEAFGSQAPTYDQGTNEDVFTTIEERKTWHRISRFGTMRKHNSGNDENYRRVKWANSKIREKTVQTVGRWRTEDGVVLSGGNSGSMFGWDDKAKRNSGPINMSAIWADRASKHRSMPISIASKTVLNSPTIVKPKLDADPAPPTPQFGWSSEDSGATEKLATPSARSSLSLEQPPVVAVSSAPPKPLRSQTSPTAQFGWSSEDTVAPEKLAMPPARSSLSFERHPLPSLSPISTPEPLRAQPSPRPTSMDFSSHPRVASIKGLGHRSTMSLDRKSSMPTSSPTTLYTKPVLTAPVLEASPTAGVGKGGHGTGRQEAKTGEVDLKLPLPTSATSIPAVTSVLPVPRLEELPLSKLPSQDSDNDDDWGDMVSSTGDLDTVFEVQNSAVGRNRADSAPGHPALERVSYTKRPISLQVGALSSSSLADLAGLDSLFSSSSQHEIWKPEEQEKSSSALISKPVNNTSTPSFNPIPMMPKLSNITDDLDAWATTFPSAVPTEGTAAGMAPSTNIITHPTPAPKSPTITIDDIDLWASLDEVPTRTSETVPAATNNLPASPRKTSPLSKSTLNELDGWGDADFSIFETAVPASGVGIVKPTPKGKREETQNTGSSEKNEKMEWERKAQSIVEKLPDLRYMLRR